eukprot:TRINITY_DN12591_c0_g1_i2.p1 TRINITY_DN12591_c0_g1~~TRINITY_DN12591_c0_g1_i2.p1  ORF type:complete len:352 (-),score=83.42 TRINITY_DN12591_c0_g1_i2:50-1054(-)
MPKKKNKEEVIEGPKKKIGTHGGHFHCDEVLACFMLKQTAEWKHAEIVRTRDPLVLESCDLLVDVGSIYDPEKNRFDHHQRSFNETFSEAKETKLSSAGLIYRHFGKELIQSLLKLTNETDLKLLYDKIYDDLIESLDAVDNGIEQYDGQPKFNSTTHLSARIHRMNPRWTSKDHHSDSKFKKAMEVAGMEFMDILSFTYESWLPARQVVIDAIENRFSTDASGKIIYIDNVCPWEDHLFALEKEISIEPLIQYVVFPGGSKMFRVTAVAIRPHCFELRNGLKKEWRGLTRAELEKQCEIPDTIFVHHNGWIGGNLTKEGAIEMAKVSMSVNLG